MPVRRKAKRRGRIFKADDTDFAALFSLGRLRKTWDVLRRELRQLGLRDCVDWIDWAHTVEATLPQLRNAILDGSYQPAHPTRYELAKAKVAPRSMACLRVRDALVYRHLSDEILQRAQPGKVKGAFFSRSHTAMPVGRTYTFDPDDYARFFEIWLHFQQYRTRTLLNRPYKVLVTTDITNYFDSIQHDLLLEYLAPLGLPRKAVALLGRRRAARFMYLNPARKKLVSCPEEWRWSRYNNFALKKATVPACAIQMDYVRLPEGYRA